MIGRDAVLLRNRRRRQLRLGYQGGGFRTAGGGSAAQTEPQEDRRAAIVTGTGFGAADDYLMGIFLRRIPEGRQRWKRRCRDLWRITPISP